MENVTQETGSQTVESQQEKTSVSDAFAAFGLDMPGEQQASTETNEQVEDNGDSPTKETPQTEPKAGIKVKFNKEEIEIPDDQVPEYVQKGLALDKERERKSEYEKALDRAAKLAGYNDRSEYLANLDKLEQQRQEQKQSEFEQLRTQIIEEFEESGGDPRNLEAWLDNNPLLAKAKELLAIEQQRNEQQKQEEQNRQWTDKWSALYQAYPELKEASVAFAQGTAPEWYTVEMQDRILRGYDPVDAYELAHRSTINERNMKQARQQTIKDVHYGRRSQVETVSSSETEPSVPDNVASAFAAFGLNPSSAKKYLKK